MARRPCCHRQSWLPLQLAVIATWEGGTVRSLLQFPLSFLFLFLFFINKIAAPPPPPPIQQKMKFLDF